jgi:ATP-dependent exoDNAse (exonuclease V) beta subunit
MGSVARELPVILGDADGSVWEGTVDLVAGTPDSPVVVDTKTTEERQEDLDARYAGQLERYAEAVRRAVGLDRPPPTRIEAL